MGKFWDQHIAKIDPDNFRRDSDFVGEQPNYPYRQMAEYLRGEGLEILKEDGSFGVAVFPVEGTATSRDSLDSTLEASLLYKWTRPANPRVLDIGPGYGRMIVHLQRSLGWLVDGVDPVELSRKCARRYIWQHHGLRCQVWSPETMPDGHYDLAINVHSWPECSRAEIRYWLDWLRERRVPQLFLVPHTPEVLCNEDGYPFLRDILDRGYVIEHDWIGPSFWPRRFLMFGLQP